MLDSPVKAAPRTAPRRPGVVSVVQPIRETAHAASAAVARRERRYRRALVTADVLSATMALLLCTVVLGDTRPTALVVLGLPLVVLASKLHGLYDRDELVVRKTTIDEAPALFRLATMWTLVVWLLGGVLLHGTMKPAQAAGLWLALTAFALLFRAAARRTAGRGAEPERLLGIGDITTYRRLSDKLALSGAGAELVGRVGVDAVSELSPSGVRHPSERALHELVRELDAHRVLVEPTLGEPQLALELVRALKAMGVRVSIVPQVLDVVGNAVVFDEIAGMTMLGVRRFELSRTSRALKRGLDLVGALAALVVFAPVLLVLAIAVKLDTPGPVLFMQERVGRDGRRFRICKLRTMVADAEARKHELHALNEATGLFKIADDPRITRVGRFARRTCLDELPQLLNVLRGEMSLVGPRPLILSEDETISGYDRRRLHLTPGMTGIWQVMGSSRVPLHEMVKIDYLYITTWTLFEDVKILLRTAHYVLSRRGM